MPVPSLDSQENTPPQLALAWDVSTAGHDRESVDADYSGSASSGGHEELVTTHLPSYLAQPFSQEDPFPDWMVKAGSALLTAIQQGDDTALALANRIQDNLAGRRHEILIQTQSMDQTASEPLLDALSFGSHVLARTLDATVAAMADTEAARHFRTYLVFSIVRVVIWSGSDKLLEEWWQGRGVASVFASSEDNAENYPILTSQEVDALLSSICHAPGGLYWKTNAQAGTRIYERNDLAHSVRLELNADERLAGLTTDALEKLTLAQDADAMFAVLYVSRVLAPPTPLPANLRAGAWIEADDVIEKIGWKPRSAGERQEMRRRVWNYLRFGARACITGNCTGVYFDRSTGKSIDTYIDGPAWAFLKEEKPAQPNLFGDDEIPVRVELVVSQEWTRLTTSPLLAQYLPMGELLGGITPDQPSGAWARVLGLALSSFWRRHPRETIDGTLRPTRREILEHYPPKVAPPEEIFASKNPRRALDYWYGALQILVQIGFVQPEGEATLTAQKVTEQLPRKGWKAVWLDEQVILRPGPAMAEAVMACSRALPVVQPRSLENAKRRAGRPRKRPTAEQ